jgi:hypothetical protein
MLQEQELDAAAGALSTTFETGCTHPGLIDHHQVARSEQLREVEKAVITEVSCVQESSGVSGLDGTLRDRAFGEVVNEVGDLHLSEERAL